MYKVSKNEVFYVKITVYYVEKSSINFIGKIEIIYNFEKFSRKPPPFEFLGVDAHKSSKDSYGENVYKFQ